MGHRVLRSFLESYHVVGQCLLEYGASAPPQESELLAECLALGEQFRLQDKISSSEAVSTSLFRSALKLAHNRGLLAGSGQEVAELRRDFAAELADLVRRVRLLSQLEHAPATVGRLRVETGIGTR
jgi:glycerol-3-phosphate O-acyltransferase